MATKRKGDRKETDADRGDIGGGILGSLAGFINNLGDLADAGERLSKRQTSTRDAGDKGRGDKAGGENSFGRILSGLTDIADKLNEISEKGETVTKKRRIYLSLQGRRRQGGVRFQPENRHRREG